MERKKYVLISVVIILVIIATSISSNLLTNKSKINKILTTPEYSYLPKEAQNFIIEEYEKTGKVILTEKNKEEGKGYLNPSYVKYLTMSKIDRQKEEIIPMPTIVEYQTSEEVTIDLPKKYDLRNIDGKRYITPARDQGELGICWSFATTSLLESHLLNKNKTPYTNDSKKISDRHFDYITATDSINDYKSEYTSYFDDRLLGEGGNFYISTEVMASGVGLVDYNSFKSDHNNNPLELNEVINYNKSLYEVNRTFNMELLDIRSLDLTLEEDLTKKNNYLNTIKSYIMKYGGAFVSTTSPQSGCAYFDSSAQNYVIDNNGTCNTSNHAMEIIGWDDDVEYTYCNSNPYEHTDIEDCNTSDIVTGKGVWILKNSWGEDSSYNYPYLAYDSNDTSINFITEVNDTNKRTWDNNYVVNYQNVALGTSETEFNLDNIDIKNNEKLNKIKFVAYNRDFTYNVTITTDDKKSKVYNISSQEPGLITLDLSNEDIIVNSSSKILVSGGNNLFYNTLYVFTNNIDTNKYLSLTDLEITSNSKRLYSITKNIPSNSKIEYKLYNNDKDVSSKLKVSNNIVGANKINTLLDFDTTLLSGNYTLKTIYNEEVINTSNINIKKDELSTLTGNGTIDNPYIITTADELYLLNSSQINNKYFILGNNIDLTGLTYKGGKYYNNGTGWEPIEGFSGNFDGKNYTIKGINSNNEIAGLFKSLNNGATIKNLVLEDFNIIGSTTGALVGSINTTKDITIQNIAIKNSTIKGSEYAGSLIGNLDNTNSNVIIENIFTDSYVEGKNAGGITGSIINSTIKNIEVLGVVIGDNSSIISSYTNKVNIENIISTVTNINKDNDLDKLVSERVETNIINYKLYDKDISVDNSIFNDWVDFTNNWRIEIVDEIERIPVLKFLDFDYVKLTTKELNVKLSDQINIYDYITNNKESHKRKLLFEGLEVNSDGIIKLKEGLNELKIINLYDGGNYKLKLNVIALKYSVKFDSNGGTGNMEDISVNVGIEQELPENTFTKEGYIFDSWNTKADGTGDKVKSINFDAKENDIVTLYATWKPKTMKIIFDVNEGNNWDESTCKFTLNEGKCQKEVTFGSSYGELPIPKREEYEFLGWYTSLENGNLIKDTDIVNKDLVLYALWIKDDYDIKNATIKDITSQSYTAKYIKPNLNIKYNDEELILNKDYIVSYLNNKNVGTSTIKITGIGKYKGEITKTFKIVIGKSKSLIMTNKTTNSITLKWNKPTGKITGYRVYMKSSKNGKYKRVATITKSSITSYKKTNLTSGKTYYFKVRSYYKTKKKYYYSDYVYLVTSTQPKAPSIKVSSNTNSATIKWNKISGVSGYEVFYSTDKKKYTKVGTTKSISLKATNLKSAKKYYYKVRAYKIVDNIKINGKCSKVVLSTTKPLTPSIENSALSYNYATIKWNKISGVNGYEVYRSTNGKKYTKIKTTTSLSYKNTNLKIGTNYYYKVRAYKTVSGKKVYSSYSKVLKVKPRLITPKITAIYNDNSIIISYNKISGATGYQIYRSEDKENYTLLKTTTATSYKDLKITSGKTYYYKVRAYKKVSKSYYYSYLSNYIQQKVD